MTVLTRDQVKARIVSELASLENPIDANHVDVVGHGKTWKTIYRPASPRIDEVQFAALYEVRRRLAAELVLS